MKKIITGFHLKMIAVAAMFMDHFSAIFLAGWINASYKITEAAQNSISYRDHLLIWSRENAQLLWSMHDGFRWIGRFAFPLYCFLLIEGFLHTKNVGRYVLRLFLFALVSEIPFDLSFNGSYLEKNNNNVFFSLCFGVLLIWGISYIEKWVDNLKHKGSNRVLCSMVYGGSVAIIFLVAARFMEEILSSDYSISGVVAILILYLGRKRKMLSYTLAVVSLAVVNMAPVQLMALPTIIPVYFYGGERGKKMKYFFYLFYPAHLLFLLALKAVMGIYVGV